MLKTIKIFSTGLCAISLSACMNTGTGTYPSSYHYENPTLYPDSYETYGTFDQANTEKEQKKVVVPESYHVGAYHSPVPSKDVDRAWVNEQNPQGYTIEVANDAKASRVANTLQKAPKSERMAEVKYQRNGETAYKGLYGTYPSQEAAQQALEQLPDELKKEATVKNWGHVQSNITE